jgi:hypothetical protein
MRPTATINQHILRLLPLLLLCLVAMSLSSCQGVVCTFSNCTNGQNSGSSSSSNLTGPAQTVNATQGFPAKVGGGNIYAGQTFQTDPNVWTVVQGDVSYIDPSSGATVFVKSAHGAAFDAQNVGSILAVRGSIKIIGINQAGYQLFVGSATDDQIKQLTGNQKAALTCNGGGCSDVSIVIIDNGNRIE